MSNHLTIHGDKHEKITASLKLLSQLTEGEESAKEHAWYDLATARALLAEPKATRKKV